MTNLLPCLARSSSCARIFSISPFCSACLHSFSSLLANCSAVMATSALGPIRRVTTFRKRPKFFSSFRLNTRLRYLFLYLGPTSRL